jgi:phenylacetate-CoA ligase
MAGLVDRIYMASPVWMQQALVAAYGAWWYRRRFGPEFRRLVADFESRSHASAEELRDYQHGKLARLLESAARSPYYGPLLREISEKDPFARLALIPLLTKETLRSSAKQLLTQAPGDALVFRSSGTTGTPSEIYYPREFHALELAVPEARNLRWAGVDYRKRRVMFGARKICRIDQARPPYWRISPVEDMAYCSIYHLSPKTMRAYVDFLRAFRPVVVMGYPSSLSVIAQFAIDNDLALPPAKAVITTSETVTADARRVMEQAWSCRLWDRYGAVEGCLFASQCEHGAYHVSPDVGIVEILDGEGHPCRPGEMGEIVVTGLHNTLQPLIRYRIGDAARWALNQSCDCGRAMPILEAIDGRIEDMCVTPDGRQTLRFDTVFKGVETIKLAQVIQRAADRFEILVVPTPGFGPRDISTLQANMHEHVGGVTTVVTTVDDIPRSASGKFRAVISELTDDHRRQLLAQTAKPRSREE